MQQRLERRLFIRLAGYYLSLKLGLTFSFSALYALWASQYLTNWSKLSDGLLRQSGWMSLLTEVIVLTTLLLIAKKKIGLTLRAPRLKWKDLIWVGCGMAAILLIGNLVAALSHAAGWSTESPNEETVQTLLSTSPIYMVLLAVLVAPMLEEFVFRKGVIRHILPNMPAAGLFASSVSFGAIHMIEGFQFAAFLQYSAVGVVLGVIYMKTKRIEVSIMLHMLNNLIGSLISIG